MRSRWSRASRCMTVRVTDRLGRHLWPWPTEGPADPALPGGQQARLVAPQSRNKCALQGRLLRRHRIAPPHRRPARALVAPFRRAAARDPVWPGRALTDCRDGSGKTAQAASFVALKATKGGKAAGKCEPKDHVPQRSWSGINPADPTAETVRPAPPRNDPYKVVACPLPHRSQRTAFSACQANMIRRGSQLSPPDQARQTHGSPAGGQRLALPLPC